MRKHSHRHSIAIICTCLLSLGCQKDIKQTSINGVSRSNNASHGNANLRLVSVASDYGAETFEYNNEGLLSEWFDEQVSSTFRHEYDDNGNLLISRAYDASDILQTTIKFFYNSKGQRFHEFWYAGNTDEVIDEVIYSFNNKGECFKIESPVQHYLVLNEYTSQGNLQKFRFYSNNSLIVSAIYTFDNRYKNPFSAVPGLLFAYPYANGFFYANKWYSTSESFTFYDENGNPVEEFTQDPSKTVVEVAPSNYVGKSDFWDEGTSSFIHFAFSYEKGSNQHIKTSSATAKKSQLIKQLLLRGTKKSVAEKVKELRNAFNN